MELQFETDFETILEKIVQVDPLKYEKTRNFLDSVVTYFSTDRFVALDKANTLVCAGLDAYYETRLIGRLAFARPFQPTTKLPD